MKIFNKYFKNCCEREQPRIEIPHHIQYEEQEDSEQEKDITSSIRPMSMPTSTKKILERSFKEAYTQQTFVIKMGKMDQKYFQNIIYNRWINRRVPFYIPNVNCRGTTN